MRLAFAFRIRLSDRVQLRCCGLRLSLPTLLCVWTTACSGDPADAERAQASSAASDDARVASNEIVSDIGASCWIVFQDAGDNYWFGSDGNGVCRYDGKIITRFTTRDGLANDRVREIQQHAPTGDILVSTLAGVSRFDGKRFVHLPMTEMTTPDPQHEQGWRLDPDDVWTRGSSGPCRYDGRTLYALQFPKSPREGAYIAKYPDRPWSPYDVWCVYRDRSGHMWFGTGYVGICRFDGRTWEWMYESHMTELPGYAWFGFRSIIEDNDGAFWFCNTKHRYRFTRSVGPGGDAGKSGGELAYTREPGVDPAALPPGASPIYFQSVVADQAGDLWMATYGYGVWRYDGRNMTHYPIVDGAEVVTLFSIYRDRHDGLWLGTHEHGAYRFNGESFERFAAPGDLATIAPGVADPDEIRRSLSALASSYAESMDALRRVEPDVLLPVLIEFAEERAAQAGESETTAIYELLNHCDAAVRSERGFDLARAGTRDARVRGTSFAMFGRTTGERADAAIDAIDDALLAMLSESDGRVMTKSDQQAAWQGITVLASLAAARGAEKRARSSLLRLRDAPELGLEAGRYAAFALLQVVAADERLEVVESRPEERRATQMVGAAMFLVASGGATADPALAEWTRAEWARTLEDPDEFVRAMALDATTSVWMGGWHDDVGDGRTVRAAVREPLEEMQSSDPSPRLRAAAAALVEALSADVAGR